MIKYLMLILYTCVLMLTSSCKKEYSVNKFDMASFKLKEIVGEKGRFMLLNENEMKEIPLHSIEEFKVVYNEFNRPKKFTGIAEFKQIDFNYTNNSKKTFSTIVYEEYEDDGPRPAGYYHASFPFYVSYTTSINNNILPHGFYTMHLDFNTDQFGKVIGNPTVSFTGIGFFSWTYINSSLINFNSATTTSTFTITGNNLFGIQIGGLTLGWTNRSNYYFMINMDSDYKNDAVKVEQK